MGYFSQLLKGHDLTFDQKGEVIQAMHNSQIRDSISETIKIINSPKLIENGDTMTTLGEVIKYMLTAFIHEKDDNYKVIYSVLHVS